MSSPQRAEIARRAYEIWEREGRRHGRDLAHWYAAERELEDAPPLATEERTAPTEDAEAPPARAASDAPQAGAPSEALRTDAAPEAPPRRKRAAPRAKKKT